MIPKIAEVGKLWKDPEISYTPAGKAVCKLSIVFSKRKKTENEGWIDDKELWIKVTVWEKYAENCMETLTKGDLVMVSGELYQRKYTDNNGQERTSLELQTYEVAPILKHNSAKINRADRSSQGGGGKADNDPWATSGTTIDAPPLDSDTEAPF